MLFLKYFSPNQEGQFSRDLAGLPETQCSVFPIVFSESSALAPLRMLTPNAGSLVLSS